MTVRDSRRQTGAGRLLDAPGAALEALLPPGAPADAFAAAWQRHARALADALGWPDARLAARAFASAAEDGTPLRAGLSLALTAPVDGLLTAAEANEAAARAAWAEAAGGPPAPPDLDALLAQQAREADPALVALVEAAGGRGVCALWDDEAVTLGLGACGRTFPRTSPLPDPADVPWAEIADVPVALVTGTNGKSTTVRMLAAVARAAGHTAGVSTTDYVDVGDERIESGDFSGPMGARAALRDRRVTLGLLEVARGGLLRRGVPVPRAAAAAVTNVAADHLGEYGVETVAELAEAKFVVARALGPGGTLVLSAECPHSAAEAARQADALARRGVRLAWTALDADHPRLAHAALAAAVVGGAVAVREAGGAWTPLAGVAEMPAALGGTARHNVRNALTAAATAAALGLPADAIAAGLRAFRGDAADNPGRANRFEVRGATVVLDYAHNAHGMAALLETVGAWPEAAAGRRLVLLSAAGDRSDADLRALADVAAGFRPDRALAADLPGYRRGRAEGEAPAALLERLAEHGVPDRAAFPDPPAAVADALAWARPGDVLVLVVLSHRDEVTALVRAAAG